MFNTNPGKFNTQYSEAKKNLEQHFSSFDFSLKKETAITELISQFKTEVKGIINDRNIAMIKYLESLTKSIPSLHVGEDPIQMEPISLRA